LSLKSQLKGIFAIHIEGKQVLADAITDEELE